MPIPELLGSAEAAVLLEIGPTNFSHLRKKMEDAEDKDFPTPVVELRCGPIWTKSSMVSFKKKYDSRRRRVRSSNGDTAAAIETPAPKAPKATKAAAAKAPAKPRKTAAKGATVADITKARKPRLKVKSPA